MIDDSGLMAEGRQQVGNTSRGLPLDVQRVMTFQSDQTLSSLCTRNVLVGIDILSQVGQGTYSLASYLQVIMRAKLHNGLDALIRHLHSVRLRQRDGTDGCCCLQKDLLLLIEAGRGQ